MKAMVGASVVVMVVVVVVVAVMVMVVLLFLQFSNQIGCVFVDSDNLAIWDFWFQYVGS